MKIKINYGELNGDGDISQLVFTGINDVREWINHTFNQHNGKKAVYLVYIEGTGIDEIFVTENPTLIQELFNGDLNCAYPLYDGTNISIHEYDSYESAYGVALMMQEPKELCYSKK